MSLLTVKATLYCISFTYSFLFSCIHKQTAQICRSKLLLATQVEQHKIAVCFVFLKCEKYDGIAPSFDMTLAIASGRALLWFHTTPPWSSRMWLNSEQQKKKKVFALLFFFSFVFAVLRVPSIIISYNNFNIECKEWMEWWSLRKKNKLFRFDNNFVLGVIGTFGVGRVETKSITTQHHCRSHFMLNITLTHSRAMH